jgi:prepilin-type N-terminal cleavage/methylation domain-containing protein
MKLPLKRQRALRAFTLVELLVVIAIIGILVALLLPAIQAAREAARRAQCQSNIKNVALAVLNYESAKQVLPKGMTFPVAQRGTVSRLTQFGPNWIIEILPYLEEQALHDSFDPASFMPPDSAGFIPINDNTAAPASNRNYIARGATIPVLLCPSDENGQILYDSGPAIHGGNWARTNYAANAGRGDIWPDGPMHNTIGSYTGPDSASWLDGCLRGLMGPNASVKLRQITDGTSKTIMIGEIRTGLSAGDARGVWAMGHAGASLLAGYGAGGDDNGPNACAPLTEGRADDVYSDICRDPSALAICMGCDPGYFAQATVRSTHVGGAYLAMCDGSVQFVSDDIETSGPSIGSTCCSPWDYMIMGADSGMLGPYNGLRRGGCDDR